MENETLTENNSQAEFSDVEIKYLAETHEKKQKKLDDIIAFQAVLCILTVIAFFIAKSTNLKQNLKKNSYYIDFLF